MLTERVPQVYRSSIAAWVVPGFPVSAVLFETCQVRLLPRIQIDCFMKKCRILIVSVIILATACNNDPIAKLPEFEILLEDSTTIFNSKNIPNGIPVLLIQFSADCKECQEETSEILANIDFFKNTNIYFITYEPFERMKVFISHYKLNNYHNVTVGYDYSKFLPAHFKMHSTPLVAVYDKRKNLKVLYQGKTTIEKLKKSVSSYQ
ncbi:redoxin domain-containing protein [Chitinophaga sp. XS-30]|uniref:redoxin domain-containing protein n=1 Tax=Chitinophaga sp. XS-30 TaxID=2604421 RepID=UPI0011DD7ACC|nr:redoxin domain-containing protein [Chitinophaga sp. XS-30]QEH40623.1 redoxin domain-containing protein [Chitinophaga sp. XS-30]